MTRSTIAKTFAIGAVAALALGLAPMAKAERKECSVATLEGSFVRRDTGFVTAPPTIAGPLAGVSLLVFERKWNIYVGRLCKPERQRVRVDWNGHLYSQPRLHG